MKEKIELYTLYIVSHLVFYLDKKISLEKSKSSGSTYIFINELKIKISDHSHHLKNGDIFIDVKLFTDQKFALKYLINELELKLKLK